MKKVIQLMGTYRNPKPNHIADRFKFNSRNRLPDEAISTYIAELRQLTEHCNFGTTLQEILRDRLMWGIRHDRLQQRPLSEGGGLTFEKSNRNGPLYGIGN